MAQEVRTSFRFSEVQPRVSATVASNRPHLAVSIDARSGHELARRIAAVRAALKKQGGDIAFIFWSHSVETSTQTTTIHYWLPQKLQ